MKRHSKVFKVPQWYLICFTYVLQCRVDASHVLVRIDVAVQMQCLERWFLSEVILCTCRSEAHRPGRLTMLQTGNLSSDRHWRILNHFDTIHARYTCHAGNCTFHLAKIRRERARQGIRVPTASQPVTLVLFFAQDFFQSFDDLRKRFCKPSSTPSGHIWPLQLQSDHEFCGTQLLTSSKTKSTTHVSTLSFMCSSTASCPICCMKKFSPIRGNTRCLGSVWIVQMFVKFCGYAGISKLGTSPAVAKEGPTPVGVPVVTPWLARPAKVQANLVINQPQWLAKTCLLWAEECYNATT